MVDVSNEQNDFGHQRLRGSRPHKNKPQACGENIVEITKADLPLCCPGPEQRVWDAHPRVYLSIDAQHVEVSCPYCSTKYKFIAK